MDWNEGRALIIGKGDRQAVVRFSQRSLGALRDYLNAGQSLMAALDAHSHPYPYSPATIAARVRR